jgi:GNAT superfamily N-acetyltransferase
VSPEVIVRPARADDLGLVLRLYAQLNPRDPVLMEEDAAAIFAQQLATPPLTMLVAEVEGLVVATCMMVITPNLTCGGQSWAIIENVVTDEACRGEGIGRKLIENSLARAWSAGCYKAALLAGSKIEARLRLYKAAGFHSDLKTGFQIRRQR